MKKSLRRTDAKAKPHPEDLASSPTLNEEDKPEVVPPPTKRTRSEVMKAYWREVKEGRRERIEHPREIRPSPDANHLLGLPDEERSKLYMWIRDCPYRDAIQTMLKEKGFENVTNQHIDEFFASEARYQAEARMMKAAAEADALVEVAEEYAADYPRAILMELGQRAFQQLSRGDLEHPATGRLLTLFLRARSDERSDQMHALKREHLRQDLQHELDQALEKLSEEVARHPAAHEAFDALQRELKANAEEKA